MKKVLLTAAAFLCFVAARAQLFDIGSITRVALPEGTAVEQAVLSPDGTKVAFTDYRSGALALAELSTGDVTHVSDSGIALDLAFMPDSRNLIFNEVNYGDDHLRRVSVKSFDASTGRISEIFAPTRDLGGVVIDGNAVCAVDGRRMHARSVGSAAGKADVSRPVLSIDRGQLCITENGRTRVLSPLGTEGMSYLWPSLSPDGSRICFYAAGLGCYTCRTDGSDIRKLGWIRAARWYDNSIIVGMHDRTDGDVITTSELIAKKADGSVAQKLTDSSYVALYPSVSEGKIGFSTLDGHFYIINVNN